MAQSYENAMPLCTMSQWGWHSTPAPADLNGKTLRLTQYDSYGRAVGYQTSSEGQTERYNWLREMRRTLFKVMKEWKWDQTWGWDYPLTAMTAARLGEGRVAIEALLMTTEKNRYLRNGHNWQRPNPPCYLPGNGGLLYAVAVMIGGWRSLPRRHAPGFPDDGSWTVRSEGLNTKLMARL